MKRIGLTLTAVGIIACSFAQNIFTYGNKAVTKDEFISAFKKNPDASSDRQKALNEYLRLYIKFKLKVQAAYDAGLDKDPTQQHELQNFRDQLADNIINEEANLKTLVKEAFERAQKEIHLSEVFIEIPGNADTLEGYKNIQKAYTQLQQEKDFREVSREFSTDEAARQAKGELGFITVFTLPYDLETIAYNLPTNSFSKPVKTNAGYIILKKTGERKSLGTRRVAQIMIAYPSDATAEDKNIALKKADSVYNLLQKGANFAELATIVSNDISSSNNKGELPEFSTGTYSADFENAAFSLHSPGDICRPFQTTYGFHILKLLEAKPVAADLNNPAVLADYEALVNKDSRMEKSKVAFIKKKLELIKFKPAKYNEKQLFAFTDSAMIHSTPVVVQGIDNNTLLFSFAKQNIKAADWIKFVKTTHNSSVGNSGKDYSKLFKEFIQSASAEYYRKNLEDYNTQFAKQVKEFKEANLLFGMMEKNVWSKANTDTIGLQKYYNLNRSKYIWQPSADAIIVTCNNLKLTEDIQQKLKDSASSWRTITSRYGNSVVADSNRFELGQLPVAERTNFTPGLLTLPVKNTAEETYTFNYIINVYRNPAQRNFDDSKGLVISDYQQVLEEKWIAGLEKKYPVKINETVFKSIK